MSSEHDHTEVDTLWCDDVNSAWSSNSFRKDWMNMLLLTQSPLVGDFVIFYWSMLYDQV